MYDVNCHTNDRPAAAAGGGGTGGGGTGGERVGMYALRCMYRDYNCVCFPLDTVGDDRG